MPTISVRQYDYAGLKTKLKHTDKIVIVSCNSCARQCANLGGENGLQALAGKLEFDGFKVVHCELVPTACSVDHWRKLLENKTTRTRLEEADVLISLSCKAGEKEAAETAGRVRLLRVTKTLGEGTFSPETGALLTEPMAGVEVDIDEPEGLPISEAAKRLGLHHGSF